MWSGHGDLASIEEGIHLMTGSGRRARWALVALTMLVGAACGTGSDSSSGDSDGAANPGRGFDGVYSVALVPLNNDGSVNTTAPPIPAYDWVVQSVCDDPDGRCIAIAQATEPDPQTNLRRDRVELVYDDGQWTRSELRTPQDCKDTTTGAVLDRQPAVHVTTLTAVGLPSDTPIEKLTGTAAQVVTGFCAGTATSRLTITRTGDLPDGTAAPTDASLSDPVIAPGADVFRGVYSLVATKSRGPGEEPPSTRHLVATPTCTRSADLCLVAAPTDANPAAVWQYGDGTFTFSFQGMRQPCPGSPAITGIPSVSFELRNTTDAAPATRLTGTQTMTFTGECAAEVVYDLNVTRLAD